MPPVSREERLVTHLKGQTNQRAKRADVVAALTKWMTPEQADRAIEAALDNPSSAVTSSWGKTLVFWGLENRSTVALYDAVGNAFAKYWGPNEFGLKRGKDPGDSSSIVTHRPRGKPAGDWSMPDLVVFAHPRKKRSVTSPREIHAFEIEQHKGFKIQSVYQAYEQARGANYAWVFAHADSVPNKLETAARDLGVGVVTFMNPNSSVTYSTRKTAIMPKRRDVSPSERKAYLNVVDLEDVG